MWLDRFRVINELKQPPATPILPQARSIRFQLDRPVFFVVDGHTYKGQSLNVSDSGLLAKCDRLPEIWTEGQLFLEAAEHHLQINARVARLQGNDVGFAFSIVTENDRACISLLIRSVLDRPLPSDD